MPYVWDIGSSQSRNRSWRSRIPVVVSGRFRLETRLIGVDIRVHYPRLLGLYVVYVYWRVIVSNITQIQTQIKIFNNTQYIYIHLNCIYDN